MYKKILVPVDGSEPAARGVAEALQLAQSLGSSLRLVHVLNQVIAVSPESTASIAPQTLDALRRDGEAILREAEALIRAAGVTVDSVLLEIMGGTAGGTIVRQAADWHAELIVMGTHGRRGVRRLLLGSDAEIVLRQSPVPILLVRAGLPASR